MKTPRSFQLLVLSALSLLLLSRTDSARADESACFANCEEGGMVVCGDDGLPYANECQLRYHSCLNPRVLGPNPALPLRCLNSLSTSMGGGDTTPGAEAESSGSEGSSSSSSSSSDEDQGGDFPEQPFGDTLSFDDPDFDGIIPGEATNPPATDADSSSSSSSDSDSDDFDASPTLPPGVVIDPNAPSAADFIPAITLPSDDDNSSEDSDNDFESLAFDGSIWVVTNGDSSLGGSSDSSAESSDSGDSDDDTSHCEIMCMDRYEPVCASNGATYSNSCQLKVAQCVDPLLTFVHPGECPAYPVAPAPPGGSDDPCAYLCPMFSAPVCSEDGHIYDNKCVYASALCRDAALQDATAELCETV